MDKESIAEYVEKKLLEKGAEDVIVTAITNNKSHIKYANSKIQTTKTWETTSVSLFVAYKKRLLVSSLHDFEKKNADLLMTKLMKFANSIEPNKEYNGIAKGPFKYKPIGNTYDKKIIDLNEKIGDIAENGISTALSNGAKRSAGVVETSIYDYYLKSSNNVESSGKGTDVYFSIRSFIDKEASGHMVTVSRMLSGLRVEECARESAEIAKLAKNPSTIGPGKYDVIFSPLSFSNFIDNFGSRFSMFLIESGLSCVGDKLGKKIGSNIFSLYDDATLPNGFASAPFDQEGYPTQKNILVEKGVVKTFLHNTSTAKKYKTKSTGNSGLISPQPYNLIVENGDRKKEELFKEVKNGLWITNLWYTRFNNYNTGDFSTIPRDGAFVIKNGEVVRPVKEIRISENILNLMKNIKTLGKNTVQIRGWEVETPIVTPFALVKDVNITRPSE